MYHTINNKPKSFCGIIGVFGESDNAALLAYYGLHSLQHRGQESSGILVCDVNESGKFELKLHKNLGLVSEVFADEEILLKKLKGFSAIGHNRYSTTGTSKSLKNIQPFSVNYKNGHLGLAHNGNLTNANELRESLIREGSIFQSTSDSEIVLHLIAKSPDHEQINQIKYSLQKLRGAYCFVILTEEKLIAARDPFGFRPLVIGRTNGNYIIASETCALDINSAEYIRDVMANEIVIIDRETLKNGNIKSFKIFDNIEFNSKLKQCIFEYIYFSRPDSKIYGHSVDKIRRKLGKILALNHPVKDKDGDKTVVISVPDSSNTAALGYQRQLEKMGIPSKFEIGLIRSHYIGRTFIQPGQRLREIGVKIKFNIVKGVLENKTVVVVDDSIVRGTTSKKLIALIKEANPKEIHLRISSPPIKYPCFYGMDFPSKEELIANKLNSIEEIKNYLKVDSLEYLTVEELLDAMVDQNKNDFCAACFTGSYCERIPNNPNKERYEE